uniref:Uncharacterized protein n=1 Tax=Anguilla anguilla TaxID=7936 RepID=A0A0E9TBN9_ANGAN
MSLSMKIRSSLLIYLASYTDNIIYRAGKETLNCGLQL